MSYKDALELYNAGEFNLSLSMLDEMLKEFGDNVQMLTLSALCSKMLGDPFKTEQTLISCCNIANDAQSFYNLACFYFEKGDRSSAIKFYKTAFDLDNSYIPSAESYAMMLIRFGSLQNALNIASKVIEYHPNSFVGYSLKGQIFTQQGEPEKAIEQFSKALKLSPDNSDIMTHFLLVQNYCPNQDESALVKLTRKWAKTHLAKVATQESTKVGNISENSKIRIGYVSNDFKRHSVAYFIEPILYYHNRDRFEIFCYSFNPAPDTVTERIEKMSDHWRDMRFIHDSKISAETVSNDNIDILIDLGGITYEGISLFAHKPAPVQVSFLGYPNTTALPTIDYRFTDDFSDPVTNTENDKLYTEKLIRLESGFLSFAPPEVSPNITSTPYLKNGYVTFGSFNTFAKVNDEVIDVWSKILHRVKNSKLSLKSKLFVDESSCAKVKNRFKQRGIEPERLIIQGWTEALEAHLNEYSNIDIALDTFPYNGTTTTCEALWMGVPVVSRYGDVHRSRVGLSILTQLGMSSFATNSAREYIKQAVRMSNNIEQLDTLRHSIRNILAKSPVCDVKRTTQEIEQYYQSWVEQR